MKKSFHLPAVMLVVAMFATLCSCHTAEGGSGSKYTPRDSIANLMAQRLINEQQFVMTAETVTVGNSPSIHVHENTNFILVNGERAIIQISPAFSGGPNGVGGITADGSVSSYKVTQSKNGNTNLSFHLTSQYGSADVRLTVYNKSERATATVTSTFSRLRSTLNGKMNPLPRSYRE